MSGNDTAYALADAFGGRDKTIAAMNAKAAQLGAWDTVAVDPSGLDAPGQRSSAYDLALLGRAVMQLPAYRQVAATKTYTFPGGTDRSGKVFPAFEIQNHNHCWRTTRARSGSRTGTRPEPGTRSSARPPEAAGPCSSRRWGATVTPSWQRQAALLDWAFANAGAAAAGRDAGGARGRPAARAGRHAGPDHGGDPGPVGDHERAGPGRDDLAAAGRGGRGGRAGRQPRSVAARVGRRQRRGTRSPGWWSSCRAAVVVLGLRRWVRRAGPED